MIIITSYILLMSWIIARHLPGEYYHIYEKIGNYNRFSSKRHQLLRKIYTSLPNSKKYKDFVARKKKKLYRILDEYVLRKGLYIEHICYATPDGKRAILRGSGWPSRAPIWGATADLWNIWSETYTEAIITEIFRNCSKKNDILYKFRRPLVASSQQYGYGNPCLNVRLMFTHIILSIVSKSKKYSSAQELIKARGTSTSSLVFSTMTKSLRRWRIML